MTDVGGGKSKTACAACHRRKLKCDRKTVGCSTCRKSNIPCLYTTHEPGTDGSSTTRDGRRKPRGPYKKGKTPREKELEHVVEVLRKECDELKAQDYKAVPHKETPVSTGHISSSPTQSYGTSDPTSVATTSNNIISPRSYHLGREGFMTSTLHPSPAQVLELWYIYTSKVDPITKVIHVPTVSSKVLIAIDNLDTLDPGIEALLLSIYLASLNASEPEHILARFGVQKDDFMFKFQPALETLISTAEASNHMSLDMLTATVIYLGCRRRQLGPGTDVPVIFGRAVASARRLGLDDPEAYTRISPLECEIWRRTWWTICRHESAYAEEGQMRNASIVKDTDIELPGNYNDNDLTEYMDLLPSPRRGLTQSSFAIIMFEVVRLFGHLRRVFQREKGHDVEHSVLTHSDLLREHSKTGVKKVKARIGQEILSHCDVSRPFDWMTLLVAKLTLTKVEIFLLEAPSKSDPIATKAFHDAKASLSLDVLECHQILIKEPKLQEYHWVYRPSHQWHALTYVLDEMAKRPDASFADRAWKVADCMLSDSDVLDKHGMTPGTRSQLLVAHGAAIEARENWLKSASTASQENLVSVGPHQGLSPNVESTRRPAPMSEPELPRPEPWQFDSSLFDIKEAGLNVDLFFWPSTAL